MREGKKEGSEEGRGKGGGRRKIGGKMERRKVGWGRKEARV